MGIARMAGTLGAVLLLLLPSRAAVASQDTLRLSLLEAVQRALDESEEIAAARAQVQRAEAQVAMATSARYPQLGTSLSYNRAIKTIFDAAAGITAPDRSGIPFAFDPSQPAEARYDTLSLLMVQDMMFGLFGALPFGRRNTYVAGLQLTQPLFTGGAVRGGIAMARHGRTAAELGLEEAEFDLALTVHTAYLNLVLARQLRGIAQQGLQNAEAHLRQVAAFQESGTASEFDFLRARVELENRLPELLQIDNAAHLAELELKRLVNLPADAVLELTTDRPQGELVEVDEEALRRYSAQRPALQAVREAVGIGEAAVRVARSSWWPSVALVGNMAFQAFPSNVAPPLPGGDWRSDWSLALALSWTPFDGFQRQARVAEAQAELRQAHLQERLLEEALEVQLEAALGDYRTAMAQLRARHETVLMAERAHELAEARYASGLATQLEVADAALMLDQARVNEVQAIHDYVKALALLERLSGGRLGLLGGRLP